MEQAKWPTGKDYFTRTNVDSIVSNLEPGNITLGLLVPGIHFFWPNIFENCEQLHADSEQLCSILRPDVAD